MANMRLKDNGNIVDFDPALGKAEPDILRLFSFRSINGTLYEYKFYHKKRYVVPIDYMGATDRTQIHTWWKNRTSLTFYPDYANNPGTTYTVKIKNVTNPLPTLSGVLWDTYFSGVLELEET